MSPSVSQRLTRIGFDEVYYRILEEAPPLAPIACRVAQAGAFAFASNWRRGLLANAELALGPSVTRWRRFRCAYAMLGSMQRSIADVLAARRTPVDLLQDRVVHFDGTVDYLAARALRKGVIVAGIHMGAFEPALATLRKLERRVHVLFHPDAMPRFERARSELRRRLGIVEHRVSDGLAAWMELRDALHADEAVVMHADRTVVGQQGVLMPFLGSDSVSLPSGPLRLAAQCGAPIVPTFCARVAGGLRVWADGWIEVKQERLSAEEVAHHPAQRALVAAMERAIRAHPDQWMALADLRRGTSEGER